MVDVRVLLAGEDLTLAEAQQLKADVLQFVSTRPKVRVAHARLTADL